MIMLIDQVSRFAILLCLAFVGESLLIFQGGNTGPLLIAAGLLIVSTVAHLLTREQT